MKVRKVNKYYCDFCRKTNCSKFSISKHEKGCTKNPNRVCGMCSIMGHKQVDLKELISIFHFSPMSSNAYDENELVAIEKGLVELRERANDCPACILATIRQAGIPVPATSFDFKKECQDFWAAINESKCESCYRY